MFFIQVILITSIALGINGSVFIMGGTDAKIEDYPYQVGIRYKDTYQCGGSLIAANFVLTCAHCLELLKLSHLKIQAGSSYLDKDFITRDVSDVKIHDKFNENANIDFDLALVKVKEAFPLGETINVIPLAPKSSRLPVYIKAIATGFGRLEENGTLSEVLQKVTIPVLSDEECVYIVGKKKFPRIICAGLPTEKKKICKGDSGGPLAVNGYLVGISQSATQCLLETKVYTSLFINVAYFREWIDKNQQLMEGILPNKIDKFQEIMWNQINKF